MNNQVKKTTEQISFSYFANKINNLEKNFSIFPSNFSLKVRLLFVYKQMSDDEVQFDDFDELSDGDFPSPFGYGAEYDSNAKFEELRKNSHRKEFEFSESSGSDSDIETLEPQFEEEEQEVEINHNEEEDADTLRTAFSDIDWNSQFQAALDMKDGKEKWEQLAHLARDFVYCSKTYGKIIISEYYLPDEKKTIKPLQAGGIAGGSKYICSSIFFKFALDTDITNILIENGQTPKTNYWMYGGEDGPNDTAAQKATKNDMVGLLSYYNTNTLNLHYPLMSIIDFRGFRLIAMSILPIDKSTIRYGTADGGKTIHASDDVMNQKMKTVARILNLKGHYVASGRQKVKIYGPADVEGHLGRDNKYYVLDFGRVFPPEPPIIRPGNTKPTAKDARKIFYLLFRPEFLRDYSIPLSSDAFSGFGSIDKAIHDAEVVEAGNYLYQNVIPNFAKNELVTQINVEDFTEVRLTEILHRSGINCRHLGLVRKEVPPHFELMKKLLLTEIIARTLSQLLREFLRNEMKEIKIARQHPYNNLVLKFINCVFPKGINRRTIDFTKVLANQPLHLCQPTANKLQFFRGSKVESGEEEEEVIDTSIQEKVLNVDSLNSPKFWSVEIKKIIEEKFLSSLTEEESSEEIDVRTLIDIPHLIRRLCQQTGIKLSKQALSELSASPQTFQLKRFDLRAISARVKHLNVIDLAEGNLMFLEAINAQNTRKGIWEQCNKKFAMAVASNTNNPKTFIRWGTLLLEQSERIPIDTPNYHFEVDKILISAQEKFNSACNINDSLWEAYVGWGKALILRCILLIASSTVDASALSLWYLTNASIQLHKAFLINPASYQMILDISQEYFDRAQTVKTENIKAASFLYLRSFITLRAAIPVSPVPPSASTFLFIGRIFYDYLSIGGYDKGNHFSGMAGCYVESGLLIHPTISSNVDNLIYVHDRNLSYGKKAVNPSDLNVVKRDQESVIIYAKSESECKVYSITSMPLIDLIQLYFFPVITEDPSNSYHDAFFINQQFHLLACMGSRKKLVTFPTKKRIMILSNSASNYFLLEEIRLKLPNDLDEFPLRILFYGSTTLTTASTFESQFNDAVEKNQGGTPSGMNKIFLIHSLEFGPADTPASVISRPVKPHTDAAYLYVMFVPKSAQSRNLSLYWIHFFGVQVKRGNWSTTNFSSISQDHLLDSSKKNNNNSSPRTQSNNNTNNINIKNNANNANNTNNANNLLHVNVVMKNSSPNRQSEAIKVSSDDIKTPSDDSKGNNDRKRLMSSSPAIGRKKHLNKKENAAKKIKKIIRNTHHSSKTDPNTSNPSTDNNNTNNNNNNTTANSKTKISPRANVSKEKILEETSEKPKRKHTSRKLWVGVTSSTNVRSPRFFGSRSSAEVARMKSNEKNNEYLTSSSNESINNNEENSLSLSGSNENLLVGLTFSDQIPLPNNKSETKNRGRNRERLVPTDVVVEDKSTWKSTFYPINIQILENTVYINGSLPKSVLFQSTINLQFSPPVISLSPIILWIDSQKGVQSQTISMGARNYYKKLVGNISKKYPLNIESFSSIGAISNWLIKNSEKAMELLNANKIRIITSKSTNDEGKNAYAELIKWLKNHPDWCRVPLLLFSSDEKENAKAIDIQNFIWSTSITQIVIEFMGMGDISKHFEKSAIQSIKQFRTPFHLRDKVTMVKTHLFADLNCLTPIMNLPVSSSSSSSSSKAIEAAPLFTYYEITIADKKMKEEKIESKDGIDERINQRIKGISFDCLEEAEAKEEPEIIIGVSLRVNYDKLISETVPDGFIGFHNRNGIICPIDVSDRMKSYSFIDQKVHQFSIGDTIGCGYNAFNKQIYWTKNGIILGFAEENISRISTNNMKYFPTVFLNHKNDSKEFKLIANFGEENFLFNSKKNNSNLLSGLLSDNNDENIIKLWKQKEELKDIDPHYFDFFSECDKQGNSLVSLIRIARYSRELYLLLKSHLILKKFSPLDLSNTTIRDVEFNQLISMNVPIEKLNLSNCKKLSDYSIQLLFSNPAHKSISEILLKGNDNYTELTTQLLSENTNQLISISLWESINEKALSNICGITSLIKLDLSNCNNLTDNVFIMIIQQKGLQLEYLNLTSCTQITDKSMISLSKSTSISSLITLCISNCTLLEDKGLLGVIRKCTKLENFGVAGSSLHPLKISDEVIIELVKFRSSSLKALNLYRSVTITRISIESLCKCNLLEEIDLGHCNAIPLDSISILCSTLTSLIRVDFYDTPIDDATLLLLVKRNKNLEYLSLQLCRNISSKGIESALPSLVNIKHLNIRELPLTCDLILTLALYHMPQLEFLDITRSSNIIPQEYIEFLVKSKPNANVVIVNQRHFNDTNPISNLRARKTSL